MTESFNSASPCVSLRTSLFIVTRPLYSVLSVSYMAVCSTFNRFTAQLVKLPETQAYIYYEFLSAEIPVSCLIVGAFGILRSSSVIILCIFI